MTKAQGASLRTTREPNRRPRAAVRFALFSFLSFSAYLLLQSNPVGAQEGAAQPTPAVTPTPTETISPGQLATRVEALARLLRDVSTRLLSNEDLESLNDKLLASEEEVSAESAETRATLDETPTLTQLRQLGEYWRSLLETNLARQRDLSQRATALSETIATLSSEQRQWRATLDQSRTPDVQGTAADQARESLNQIDTLLDLANDQKQQIGTIQKRLAAEDSIAAELLEKINRERREFKKRLLKRDSLPLWQFGARRRSGESVESVGRLPTGGSSRLDARLLRERSGVLAAITIVFLLVLAASLTLRGKWRQRAGESTVHAQVADIFRYPIALSLLAALVISLVLGLSVPVPLLGLMGLALVFPVLRFLPPLIGRHWRPVLYLLSASFVLAVIRNSVAPPLPITRELDALFNAALIAGFCWLTLRKAFRDAARSSLWSRVTIRAARVWIVLIAVSLGANFFGFLRFAQVMSRATVYSAFLGVVLFTTVRLSVITLSAVLKTDRARALVTVRLRKAVIVQWTERILTTVAILFWLWNTTEFFMIREQLKAGLLSILTWRITLGTLDFSLGSILTVICVLLIGLGFSTAVRFVLREEILSRLHLSRGLPELITTLLYYGLIIIVVVLAFGAAGVEFSRLTLLTGALGVGIGFGLQNIVNNFVSGLILQFERPIHIGDILEVGGLSGEVTRIGVRSSTIQTGQGAEVIVPNAELVSGRVINWTLSSERRRIDIPVAVGHRAESKRVVELLARVAMSNPGVMRDPAPMVLFQGLGEGSLDFELRFWAPDRGSYIQLKSEVALAVAEALKAESIEVPSAQRDLYLKMIEQALRDRSGGDLAVGASEAPATKVE